MSSLFATLMATCCKWTQTLSSVTCSDCTGLSTPAECQKPENAKSRGCTRRKCPYIDSTRLLQHNVALTKIVGLIKTSQIHSTILTQFTSNGQTELLYHVLYLHATCHVVKYTSVNDNCYYIFHHHTDEWTHRQQVNFVNYFFDVTTISNRLYSTKSN